MYKIDWYETFLNLYKYSSFSAVGVLLFAYLEKIK